jgi:hypothetical protein
MPEVLNSMLGFIDPPRRAGQPPDLSLSSLAVSPP